MELLPGLVSFANRLDAGGQIKIADAVDRMIKSLAVPEGDSFTAAPSLKGPPLQIFHDKLVELIDLSKSLPKGYGADVKFLKTLRDHVADKLGLPIPKEPPRPKSKPKWQDLDMADFAPGSFAPAEEYEDVDLSDLSPRPTLPKGPSGTRALYPSRSYEPEGTSADDPTSLEKLKGLFS